MITLRRTPYFPLTSIAQDRRLDMRGRSGLVASSALRLLELKDIADNEE
ncbi:MAG TPA: hypothetical protein VGL56_02640 [Fimbriimonadaceae bacterium]